MGYAKQERTSPLVAIRVESDDQFTPPRTTGTELLDQAIKDFTDAADLLPATWDASNRVTANSANGMLGKSLVFRAFATKNAGDYTPAIAAFNKISGAQLETDFEDNFSYDTGKIQNRSLNSRLRKLSILTMCG